MLVRYVVFCFLSMFEIFHKNSKTQQTSDKFVLCASHGIPCDRTQVLHKLQGPVSLFSAGSPGPRTLRVVGAQCT